MRKKKKVKLALLLHGPEAAADRDDGFLVVGQGADEGRQGGSTLSGLANTRIGEDSNPRLQQLTVRAELREAESVSVSWQIRPSVAHAGELAPRMASQCGEEAAACFEGECLAVAAREFRHDKEADKVVSCALDPAQLDLSRGGKGSHRLLLMPLTSYLVQVCKKEPLTAHCPPATCLGRSNKKKIEFL